MLIYNKTWIDNLEIQKQSAKWLKKNFISKTEHENVIKEFPTKYHESNFIIRIGVFIFSLIVIFSGAGIFSLITTISASTERVIGFESIFFGVVTVVIGTNFIGSRNYFRSGVIDALIYFSVLSFSFGICILISGNNFDFNLDPVIYYIAVLPFASFIAIRFADAFLALVAYVLFFIINALLVMKIGSVGEMILPFESILLSVICYKYIDKQKNVDAYKYWHKCIETLRGAALATFYLSGNYFVVRKLSEALLHTTIAPGEDISLSWYFYAWTIIVPVLMITFGLKQKDSLIIRVGILLEVVGILSIRYYYSVLPLEAALIVAGIFCVVLARLSISFLREPRNGITYLEDAEAENELISAVGATVVSHVAGKSIHQEESSKFAGGQSGGGGAGGGF